ncbi:hypothetical protein BH10PSE19_BH10PSE19_15690 [soil metagenome]
MNNHIRLTQKEQEIICTTFHKYFAQSDHLWLFGSRVDLKKKGGDIDLYIETKESDVKCVVNKKIAFVNELWVQLGEQKIDVVLHLLSSSEHLTIYDIAKAEGCLLV